ncbi:MAG: carbonic anhydrase [Cyanobacteriota bacterium]|jgi:carbonic anhydrase
MPHDSLQRLLEGNQRYVANRSKLDESPRRRVDVAAAQHPFAAIFSCVDSRVPPELIFDQGLGDLMVIRTAGQVIDKAVLGSLEFAVAECQVPLIVVLGHERCGALKVAIEALAKAAPAEAEMEYLVEELAPAVHQGRLLGGDGWLEAVRAQIERMVVRLRHSPILSEAVAAGRLRIVGACYDLDSGLVTVTRP